MTCEHVQVFYQTLEMIPVYIPNMETILPAVEKGLFYCFEPGEFEVSLVITVDN